MAQPCGGANGIPPRHYVRVVREDHDRKELLYAGTEYGMYVSLDDGAEWQRLQLNLPVTPITDLQVHRKDLVLSTGGRGLWVLEDISVLQQLGRDMPADRELGARPSRSPCVLTRA